MKRRIAVGVQVRLAGSLQFIPQQQHFIHQALQRLEFRRAQSVFGRLADGIYFQRLAKFVEFGDVPPGKIHDNAAAGGRLPQEAFRGQPANSLAQRSAAVAQLTRDRNFRKRGAGASSPDRIFPRRYR